MTHRSNSRPRRTVLAVALVAAAALSATACSSSKDSGNGNDRTGTTVNGGGGTDALTAELTAAMATHTSYPAIASVANAGSLTGKTVWYIPIGAALPQIVTIGHGVSAALGKLGIKVQTCDGKFLPTAVATCMNQAASQGADAVITSYVDYTLVPTAFDNLISHHIPVLAAGVTPTGGKTSSPALAFYDTTATLKAMAKSVANSVIVDSNAKARILFVGVTDSLVLRATSKYFVNYVKAQCADCELHESDYNTADVAKLPSQVSAALISNPSTNYVVNLGAGTPTRSGIQTAGFANKVKLATVSADLDSLIRIKNNHGEYAASLGGLIYQGWEFADAIVRMLVGQPVVAGAPFFRLIEKSNVGGLELTPQAFDSIQWFGSDAFEQTFLKAWGV